MTDKKKTARRSVAFSVDVIEALNTIATKEGIDTAELIRRYVEQGLNVSKSKEDIDFIRTQIREELTIILDKKLSWISAMYYRIGAYVVPQCRFSAEIVYKLIRLTDEQHRDFTSFWNKAKEEGNRFMSTGTNSPDGKKQKGEKPKLEEIHELNEKAFGRKK